MHIASASTQGHTHRTLGYNNQDAYFVDSNETRHICIVADGCGSGSNSEVGAQLAVRFVAKYISDALEKGINWQAGLKTALLRQAQQLAQQHANNTKSFVRDYLLFTIVGCVSDAEQITLFWSGDGVLGVNDAIEIIDQNNRPKYINNELKGARASEFEFRQLPLEGQRLLIATDGFEDVMAGVNSGEISEYGSVEDLLKDAAVFDDPVYLSKLFHKYAERGVIRDDCTLVVLKPR